MKINIWKIRNIVKLEIILHYTGGYRGGSEYDYHKKDNHMITIKKQAEEFKK